MKTVHHLEKDVFRSINLKCNLSTPCFVSYLLYIHFDPPSPTHSLLNVFWFVWFWKDSTTLHKWWYIIYICIDFMVNGQKTYIHILKILDLSFGSRFPQPIRAGCVLARYSYRVLFKVKYLRWFKYYLFKKVHCTVFWRNQIYPAKCARCCTSSHAH